MEINLRNIKSKGRSIALFAGLLMLLTFVQTGFAQISSDVNADSLKFFTTENSVGELIKTLSKENLNEGIMKEAEYILEAIFMANPSVNPDMIINSKKVSDLSIEDALTIRITPTYGFDAVNIEFSQTNISREGTKKSGNRELKGSGGANSIRVDDALDAPKNAYSAAQLVQEVLVTGCLTADNITFSGNESLQIGYFNRGNAAFPISEGIVLSTGNVVDVEGDNTATNITTEVGTGGDTELSSIASGTVADASVLEFDFVPAGDTVTFNYIFASEEYPEYSCSSFNDVFGFFVTSLDNDGIGYSNQNVAQLPGGLGVVSINNVHGPGRADGDLDYSYDESLANPFGCSSSGGTTVVYSEDFSSGFSNWSFSPSQGNWEIKNSTARFDDGHPKNILTNYSHSLVSNDINLTAGVTTTLSFILKLDNFNTTGQEVIDVEVWNGTSWVTVGSYDNNSSSFTNTYNIDITAQVITSPIKIQFTAHGDDTYDINYWQIDDISIAQAASGQPEIDYYSFNVHECSASNSDYYVDQSSYVNSTGTGDCIESVRGFSPYTVYENIEADGRTVKLTATFAAVPCSTYHIKLAVGDVGDQKWDSWVFLEGSSFSSNDVELTAYGNGAQDVNEIYEGCTNNSFVVSRASGDNSQELSVDVSYSPAGINGVDIVQMDGTPLPSTIVLPAGVDSDTVFYYAVDDGNQEPAETEVFTLSFNTGCPCDPTPNVVSLDLTIYDAVSLENPDIIASNVQCAGESNGVIIVNPIGGSGVYEFSLDSISWQYSNTFSNLGEGYYPVYVRDSLYMYNCQDPVKVDSIQIEAPEPIMASAGINDTTCVGLTTTLNGSGGALFSWSPAEWLNNSDIASPTVTPTGVTNIPVSKTYTLTVTDANGNCPDTDEVTIVVNPSPTVNITADGNTVDSYDVCPDDVTTLAANIEASTQTTSSIYYWNTTEVTQSIQVSPNSSQTYDVQVQNEYGCSKTDIIQLQVYPIYVTVDATTDVICIEDADAGATINVSGHNGIFPVTVSIVSDQGYSNSFTFTEAGQYLVSDLGVGSYTVTGSSTTIGCTATDYFTVDATDDIPPVLDFEKAGDSLIIVIIPAGQPSTYVSVPEPLATDNCSVSVDNDQTGGGNASGTYPVGTTIVTYTATDSNGNDVVLTQKIEIYPDNSVSIICPDDLNLGLNPDISEFTVDLEEVTYTTHQNWILQETTYTELSDEMADPSGGTCDYIRTRTYEAIWYHKNNSSNKFYDECTRTYYYSEDNGDPAITCDSDITTTVSGVTSVTLTLQSPTVSDDCSATGDLIVSFVRSDGETNLSDPYSLGVTTITWTVTDESGNDSQCIQTITVNSDTHPGGVETGLLLWVKSNAGVFNVDALAQSGENSSLWDDYAKNHDGIQNINAEKPLFSESTTDQFNYNPGMIFDGVSDFMLSDLSSASMETTNTVFFVCTPMSNGAVVGLGHNSYIGFNGTSLIYSINDGASVTQTATDVYRSGETKVVCAQKSGNDAGNILFFLNGALQTNSQNASARLNSGTDTRIGTAVDGGSLYLEGSIAEIIIYDGVLSLTDRQKVESYLAVKYGITLDE